MEKMILVPYERYQKLLSDQKKKQTGEGTKGRSIKPDHSKEEIKKKLGPPGIPEKKHWISL